MRNKIFAFTFLCITFIYICCDTQPYRGGHKVYKYYCENCHMSDGLGLPPMYPAIKDSPYLSTLSDQLPCLIREGRQSQMMENIAMPAMKLSPIEIANLVSYMNYQFETDCKLNIKTIEPLLSECE